MIRLLAILIAAGAAILTTQAAPITALVFSRDGSSLVSNGDRRLDIRSPQDAAIQRQIPCDLPRVTTLAFSPDGQLLAVGGGEPGIRGEVQLLSWPGGKMLHRFSHRDDLITRVAFDAGGEHLAVAAADHSARVWRLPKDGEPVETLALTGHAGPVLDIAFSPSNQSIVTASADRSLKVWSLSNGRLLRTLSHHTEAVHAVAFRPHAATDDPPPVTCASAGDDRTVRIWQPEIGRMVRIIRHHEGPVLALVWSADGSVLYSAGTEGIIRRIEGTSDTIEAEWHAHDDWIYALAFTPDGSILASGDWAGIVRLHDLRHTASPDIPVAE